MYFSLEKRYQVRGFEPRILEKKDVENVNNRDVIL